MPLIILFLVMLCGLVDSSNSVIRFMGKEFSHQQWATIKQTMKCWASDQGQWIWNPETFQYNKNLTFEQNYDRLSPCYGYASNTRYHFCRHVFSSNATQYVWKPPSVCKHQLQPFSVIKLNEIMHNQGEFRSFSFVTLVRISCLSYSF